MAQSRTSPEAVENRIRSNLRLVKATRELSDERIAQLGGFTGRQIVNDRLAGRTPLDVEDIVRLAAALRIEPFVLMLSSAEAIKWLEENPDYKAPKFSAQKRTRQRKFGGVQRQNMPSRKAK